MLPAGTAGSPGQDGRAAVQPWLLTSDRMQEGGRTL
jgi:hypothetical protein